MSDPNPPEETPAEVPVAPEEPIVVPEVTPVPEPEAPEQEAPPEPPKAAARKAPAKKAPAKEPAKKASAKAPARKLGAEKAAAALKAVPKGADEPKGKPKGEPKGERVLESVYLVGITDGEDIEMWSSEGTKGWRQVRGSRKAPFLTAQIELLQKAKTG